MKKFLLIAAQSIFVLVSWVIILGMVGAIIVAVVADNPFWRGWVW